MTSGLDTTTETAPGPIGKAAITSKRIDSLMNSAQPAVETHEVFGPGTKVRYNPELFPKGDDTVYTVSKAAPVRAFEGDKLIVEIKKRVSGRWQYRTAYVTDLVRHEDGAPTTANHVPPVSIRIPTDVKDAAAAKAASENITLTDVIVAALRDYTGIADPISRPYPPGTEVIFDPERFPAFKEAVFIVTDKPPTQDAKRNNETVVELKMRQGKRWRYRHAYASDLVRREAAAPRTVEHNHI